MIGSNLIESSFVMELCKANKEVVAIVLEDYLDTVSKSIGGIDEIELTIPKFVTDRFTFKTVPNLLYFEVKAERLIKVNNKEYYVIKDDNSSDSDDTSKKIKGYSLEYKLGKIDINIEQIGFCLRHKEEDKKIFSLEEYMYLETGWKFGTIDNTVRYDTINSVNVDKMRWQQSVSTRWHDFLIKNVAESFGCTIEFDTYNKLINLKDINANDETIDIYLSHDNYIKELRKNNSSSEIITRLQLSGNEEMDIIGATTTGYKFIEDFSYFVEGDEMSVSLRNAMTKYEQMVAIRNVTWKEKTELKLNKITILSDKKIELYGYYSRLEALKGEIKWYDSKDDEINKAKVTADYTSLNDTRVILETQITTLSNEIAVLDSEIKTLNTLCKRETATDENGVIIFNQILLDELKEFIYCETYSNDSFMKVDDLIKEGKRQLSLKCRPISTYSLNIVDFTSRIVDNGFRKHWKGDIYLGNIISLLGKDENQEVLQYLVGYKLDRRTENGLTFDISDKKTSNDNTRTISDYLNDAKRSAEILESKKYLWLKQKYNKINLYL